MKIIALASVPSLLAVGIFWRYAAHDQFLFSSVLCAGSILALYHALRAQKRLMGGEFLIVALLFNPLVPLFRPPTDVLAVWVSIAATVTCLIGLPPGPLRNNQNSRPSET